MRRYRVALVTDFFLPKIGGVEHHMHDLARELNRHGHETDVVCVTPGDQVTPGIREHRIAVPLYPFFDRARGLPAVEVLEELFRKEKYDIIHTLGVSTLGPAGNFVARKLGIPSLLTVHTALKGRELPLKALNWVLPWAQWPTILTAVSSHVAGQLERITKREVFVLHNAINPDAWRVVPNIPRELRITTVGRFDPNKCQRDFIRAIPGILTRIPNHLVPKFTLIGDGPTRKRVEREARRLGVEKYTEFLGFRTREEIREVLSRSMVFVLPSIRESFAIAALEARAVGVPVVARAPNGVVDIIEHGRHGFLFQTLEELSEQVAELLNNDPLRQKMSESARQGLDWFSWEQTIARTLDLYDLATRRNQEAKSTADSQLPS